MKLFRLFFIIAFLSIFVGFYSCENGARTPDELYGVWGTAHPRYQDCRIEFRKHFIVFQSGLFYKDINYILHIDKKREGNRILYKIRYENEEGTEFDFQFYYYPSRQGAVLKLKNQEKVQWIKKSESDFT